MRGAAKRAGAVFAAEGYKSRFLLYPYSCCGGGTKNNLYGKLPRKGEGGGGLQRTISQVVSIEAPVKKSGASVYSTRTMDPQCPERLVFNYGISNYFVSGWCPPKRAECLWGSYIISGLGHYSETKYTTLQ